jgi:hypothetical protein
MEFRDGPRNLFAFAVGAATFLLCFFGLSLVAWLAFALAVAAWGAVFLIVVRRPPDEEIIVAERVSLAEIAQAKAKLDAAHNRMTRLTTLANDQDRDMVAHLATSLDVLRSNIAEDPVDYRLGRRFITSYLDPMVDSFESYVNLTRKGATTDDPRVSKLRERLTVCGPALDRINRAYLDNDLDELGQEIAALSFQISRG